MAARVARGAAWTVGMRLLDRVLGVVSTLILARLLVPADFGLVAMALAVVGLLEAFTQFGFESALIRKPSVTRADYDTAWTLNFILGVLLAGSIAASALPAANYYQAPEVATILFVLVVAPLLSAFENIGIVDFRRQLAFHRDFTLSATRRIAGTLVTIPLAFAWRNHWALVAGMLAARATSLALSYYMSPYRPRPCLEKAREIVGFSLWLLLHNVLFFLRARSAAFFLGRSHGAQSVGSFTMANDIASLPSSELVMPLDRALFPSYSRMALDIERLKAGFTRVLGLIALVAVPACVGLALVADLAVPILLGDAWLETIPLLELLALFGATIALQMNCGAVLVALGRPRLQAMVSLVQVLVMVVAMLLLVPEGGAVGAARAYLIAGLISLPISYLITLPLLRLPITGLFAVVWRPLLGAALMCATIIGLSASLGWQLDGMAALVWMLALKVAVGALTYAATVAIAWLAIGRPEGAEWDVIRLVQRRL